MRHACVCVGARACCTAWLGPLRAHSINYTAALLGAHRCALWIHGRVCVPTTRSLGSPHCGSPSVTMSAEVGTQALAPAVLRDPVGADARGDDCQQTPGLEHVLSASGSSRCGRLDRRRSDVQVCFHKIERVRLQWRRPANLNWPAQLATGPASTQLKMDSACGWG